VVEILFVHGALVRDGAWWWRPAADLILQRTGLRSTAVALPSCGETDAPAGTAGLVEDAAALHASLDQVDAAVVVGHSYGGTVIAEGADHPAVQHLVYISSYLPDAGTAQAAIGRDEPDPVPVAPGTDGTVSLAGLDDAAFDARFLLDVVDPAVRTAARSRVVPQSAAAFGTPTTRAAWHGRPSTALVCTEDRSTSAGLQRFHADRATRSVELPTGHHPFLSRPDLVADVMEEVLRSVLP
jgi:pimeloyl-ACP methyl ester carboxylesterase